MLKELLVKTWKHLFPVLVLLTAPLQMLWAQDVNEKYSLTTQTSTSAYKQNKDDTPNPASGSSAVLGLQSTPYVVEINEENFPDELFRLYLQRQKYGEDGVLTEEEIEGITYIWPYSGISSLKGIEYLTALDSLRLSRGQVTSIDLSKNTALTYLSCAENQLSSLDLSKNTALKYLNCSSNHLTSLDVTNNTELTFLSCYNNQLAALDVSKNTVLESLYCDNNQLASLDVSNSTALWNLDCSHNQLCSLDVSKNTALVSLCCNNNQLTTLDVSKNTALKEELRCNNNLLTSLDVSKNTALESLDCDHNQLASLDVSNSTALWYLDCSHNQLCSLDLSQSTALKDLLCGSNQLTSLDVSNNKILRSLYCGKNQLTELDISKNTALESVRIYRNNISAASMNRLIEGIPQQHWNTSIYVINISDENEGNVCTMSQVLAFKEKGWIPKYEGESSQGDYEGSNDDISLFENVVYAVEEYEGVRGGRTNLSIRLKNSVTAEGFDFDLTLPEGFKVANNPEGKLDVELSGSRTDDSKVVLGSLEISADSTQLHVSASPANAAAYISGIEGEVMKIGVIVDDNATLGAHAVWVTDTEIHDREGTYPRNERFGVHINVCETDLGDANNNKYLNGGDYTSILHYLWNRPDQSFIPSAADVNRDGAVTVSDLTAWIRLYKASKQNQQNAPAVKMPQMRTPE